MIHFITFANTDSNFSTERIMFEAQEMGVFDKITFYTENDFDDEFMSRCGHEFPNFRRGYGYWSWKPYIIKKELEKIQFGDIVVYADCGCMFIKKNRQRLLEWVDLTKNSESGVLSPCFGPYIEHDWTRGDLYHYINDTYNHENVDIFDKAIQCGCGVSLYAKKEKCVDFVNQWYDVMTNHFHLCTDEKSSKPNHPNFKENRHDQSVFSMLSKIYNIETIETKYGILDKENSPIICTRCKTDKNSWKKPLKVVYDYQTFNNQTFGGISRMFVELYTEHNQNEYLKKFTGSGSTMAKYPDLVTEFSVLNTKNEYLNKVKPYDVNRDGDNRKHSIQVLKDGNYDIFYPTFFDTYFLEYLGDKPFVMSVHDMIPELYPQFFPRNDGQIVGKREMVKRAAAIEVPTQTTKNDLMRILGVPEEKIYVTGRALRPDFGDDCGSDNPVEFKYILYIGQRNAYKRFDWFVKHIKPFLEKHSDINVICTGLPFNGFEVSLINRFGLSKRFFHTFVNDKQLALLYKNAECFVYPSEYEGFGIPILEAYKMGCPVLLNDTSVFREVTFGKGEYFNLKANESDLSERLEYILSKPKNTFMGIRSQLLDKYTLVNFANNFKSMFNDVIKR